MRIISIRVAVIISPKMDEELQQAYEELEEAQIEYKPTHMMRQGETEIFKLSITRLEEVDISVEYPEGSWTRLPEGSYIRWIKASGTMAAYLEGNPDEFKIQKKSSTEQALVGSSTEWIWHVTPLKPGNLILTLRVTAEIRLSDGDTVNKDIINNEVTKIEVEPEPNWQLKKIYLLLKENGELLLTITIAVISGFIWLVKRVRNEGKKKPEFDELY